MWEMPASDYICKIPTLTPKLRWFKMPDIQNYLLGFRRAVQSYKSWFLNKTSSGSKDQNDTLMIQLLEWAKPDFTMKRNHKERPQKLLEFFVRISMIDLRFLSCNQTILHQKFTSHSQALGACVVALCLSLLRSILHSRTCDLRAHVLTRRRRKMDRDPPQVIKTRAWWDTASRRSQPTQRRVGSWRKAYRPVSPSGMSDTHWPFIQREMSINVSMTLTGWFVIHLKKRRWL